jgi:hypothetical protein
VFKARSILSDDYGNVHIFIGEPVSIRNYSIDSVDRTSHNLSPRYCFHFIISYVHIYTKEMLFLLTQGHNYASFVRSDWIETIKSVYNTTISRLCVGYKTYVPVFEVMAGN